MQGQRNTRELRSFEISKVSIIEGEALTVIDLK